jgi:transcription antitermination factor NusA-like protein
MRTLASQLIGETVSIEQYKVQAERLANHLASKHGVKLKNSSLLESIAILHGQRDWNHLVASTMSPAQVAALEAVDTGAAGPAERGCLPV